MNTETNVKEHTKQKLCEIHISGREYCYIYYYPTLKLYVLSTNHGSIKFDEFVGFHDNQTNDVNQGPTIICYYKSKIIYFKLDASFRYSAELNRELLKLIYRNY